MAEFIDERTLIVDGVAFACEFPVRDAGGHLAVMKDRAMVERTMALVERLSPRRILEVGIWRGGSTALLASLARPEQMVAIDLLAREGHLTRPEADAAILANAEAKRTKPKPAETATAAPAKPTSTDDA